LARWRSASTPKDRLTSAIRDALAEPKPGSALWLARLHILVDELESVELPFTGYDRLRFGGPTSRDTLIDAIRARFPFGNTPDLTADPMAAAC
jgi:hypothetical protein